VDSSHTPAIPFLLGLAVMAGLVVPALLRLRSRLADARAEAASAGRRAAALAEAHGRSEDDLRFLTQFLKDYPRFAGDLYRGREEHEIEEHEVPRVLLSIVQRSLDPQQIVILVKSRNAAGRLMVAAVHPSGGALRVGFEVPFETGEIGFAAERQDVVNRQDLEAETASNRIKPGPLLEGMPRPDIIAPLVFDRETLGLVLVSGARRSGDPKAALRLVAQTGAQVLHTAVQVRNIKTTAELDGLTRVYNKRHLERQLDKTIVGAAERVYDRRDLGPANSISLFLFDIDHFKNYNDTHGHLAGDRLLQEISGLVNAHIRKGDTFGRFGGEEFLLIQPHTDADAGLAAAEKLRALIASHPFEFANEQPLGCMSVSGGVAQYPLHGLDASSVLRAADAALYEAKRAGRNRVFLAPAPPPPTEPAAGRRL
jgi:diguanylate cyclase (GGDEF)-like protein